MCKTLIDDPLKIYVVHSTIMKYEQQYQYFPLPWFGLVGLVSGTVEPVLYHRGLLVGVVGGELSPCERSE